MKVTLTREFHSPDKNCDACNGSGEFYASDGVYLPCQCGKPSGRKVIELECQECYSTEYSYDVGKYKGKIDEEHI